MVHESIKSIISDYEERMKVNEREIDRLRYENNEINKILLELRTLR